MQQRSIATGRAELDRPMTFRPVKRETWWGRLTGEMSRLRQSGQAALYGALFGDYRLDSSHVDYRLARQLYANTCDAYKLGAGFARPIVNTCAGFCGPPRFGHADEQANQALEQWFTRWRGTLLGINRDTLRDGDCFARLGMQPDPLGGEPSLDLWTVPPEWCEPRRDLLGEAWTAFLIRHPVELVVDREDGTTETLKSVVTERITADAITYSVPRECPPEIAARVPQARDNRFGFIPIVHFRNEPEEGSLYGTSELEAVEPFLRAYHDVMLSAIQGSQLFSRPKVKFKLADVKHFLKVNFTAEQVAAGRVNFAGKELFLLQQDDDAAFISADPGLAGIATLLEVIFYCVIDVSETPEFAFGAGVNSAKGSVAEQEIPLAKKIDRKRGQLGVPYADLARMFLAIWARQQGVALADRTIEVAWDEFSAKDEVNAATAIRTTVEAFVAAINLGVLSIEAAATHLRTLVPSMLAWDEPAGTVDEQQRVEAGLAFLARVQTTLHPPPPVPVDAGGRPQGRPPGPSSRPTESGDVTVPRDVSRNAAA